MVEMCLARLQFNVHHMCEDSLPGIRNVYGVSATNLLHFICGQAITKPNE